MFWSHCKVPKYFCRSSPRGFWKSAKGPTVSAEMLCLDLVWSCETHIITKCLREEHLLTSSIVKYSLNETVIFPQNYEVSILKEH